MSSTREAGSTPFVAVAARWPAAPVPPPGQQDGGVHHERRRANAALGAEEGDDLARAGRELELGPDACPPG